MIEDNIKKDITKVCIKVSEVENKLLKNDFSPEEIKKELFSFETMINSLSEAETIFGAFIISQNCSVVLRELEKALSSLSPQIEDIREKFKKNIADTFYFLEKISIIKSYQDLLLEVHKEYEKTEQYLNKVHSEFSLFMIAPVNELRYAGYHLNKSLEEDGKDFNKKEELRKTISHLKRAFYDCLDIERIKIVEGIKSFLAKYHKIPICISWSMFDSLGQEIFVNSFADLQKEVNRTIEKIDDICKKSYYHREEYYKDLEKELPFLKKLYEKILKDVAFYLSKEKEEEQKSVAIKKEAEEKEALLNRQLLDIGEQIKQSKEETLKVQDKLFLQRLIGTFFGGLAFIYNWETILSFFRFIFKFF